MHGRVIDLDLRPTSLDLLNLLLDKRLDILQGQRVRTQFCRRLLPEVVLGWRLIGQFDGRWTEVGFEFNCVLLTVSLGQHGPPGVWNALHMHDRDWFLVECSHLVPVLSPVLLDGHLVARSSLRVLCDLFDTVIEQLTLHRQLSQVTQTKEIASLIVELLEVVDHLLEFGFHAWFIIFGFFLSTKAAFSVQGGWNEVVQEPFKIEA